MTTQTADLSGNPPAAVAKPCPACLGDRPRPWGRKLGFTLVRCPACGTVFTPDEAGAAEIKELYDHYYEGARFQLPPVVAASLENLVASLAPYRQTGRWLDLGYGEGGLLGIAARKGWTCFGTEVSPAALEHGDRQGWVVTREAERDARFPAQGFDVITMIELLEHVACPDRLLQTAQALLRPGGVLYLTTPNANSLNRRFLGAEWSVFKPPEHLVVWTARGLRKTLARNGLNLTRVRTEGLNPGEILSRVRTGRAAATAHRNETGYRLNEAFSASPLRRRVKAGINRFLSWFRLGDSLKVWAVRPADPKAAG